MIHPKPQESAMNGIPCLSTNIMGLEETNEAGIRLPAEPIFWVDQINALDDETYYKKIVEREREHLASFEWEKKMEQIHNYIQSCRK